MKRIVVLAAALLAGCASFSPDGGFGEVERTLAERTGREAKWVRSESDADTVRARLRELLARPLSAEDAVQIALLNNAGLQAEYAELGIAEADLVQASRWSGPKFSFARLRRGNELEYERGLFFDVLGLLTIPLSTRAQQRRFEAVQSRAAAQALGLALETRRAWFEAVAAREASRYMDEVKAAAEASAELARRMAAVGNWSRLNQQREQAFYAEATAQLARARHVESAARERLTRLLGLWGEQARFVLPERLPELPGAPEPAADLEARALRQRLDVQGARREAARLAESLELTRATRFVDLLEVGRIHNTESPHPAQRGWELELRIPIFDFGGARAARSEHLYMQGVQRATDAAVRARSEVREAYSAYRTSYDLARHYRDEIVPLRKKISEEMLLRYNGMLSSAFELLADARESIASVNAYLEAQREFWLAETELHRALTAGSPAAPAVQRAAMPAAQAGAGH
jgi:outer membrane protein TolC